MENNVQHAEGRLDKNSGGQSDFHLDNLDVRRDIAKWGVVFNPSFSGIEILLPLYLFTTTRKHEKHANLLENTAVLYIGVTEERP